MAGVLVTRHLPEAEETASSLRRMGFEPFVSPVRQVEALNPLPVTGSFDGSIVTSRNALHDGVRLPEDFLRLPVFCVGARSAAMARKAGFGTVFAGGGDAEALVKTIRGSVPAGARLLYLAGEPRRATIETELARLGFHLETRVTYRMACADSLAGQAVTALRTGEIAAALHFSTESSRDFLVLAARAGVLEEAFRLHHVCLSATVAETFRSVGITEERLSIPAKPDQASLLALLRTQLTT